MLVHSCPIETMDLTEEPWNMGSVFHQCFSIGRELPKYFCAMSFTPDSTIDKQLPKYDCTICPLHEWNMPDSTSDKWIPFEKNWSLLRPMT
uniref:Uncharacterized protein n=1 Tax=Xenopus tropicalis TaxID=8364 RepID=A0A1B8Y9R6_XENTR